MIKYTGTRVTQKFGSSIRLSQIISRHIPTRNILITRSRMYYVVLSPRINKLNTFCAEVLTLTSVAELAYGAIIIDFRI